VLPIGDGLDIIFSPDSRSVRTSTVVRKISLALVLMAMTGVASASGSSSDRCIQILWWSFCSPSASPTPVQAPEIDPASAMAGLTMLAGGLAVLRGRRKQKS